MKIVPLAFESMGVRSMATFLETDQKILVDPGTSIAPKRFGFPHGRMNLMLCMKLGLKFRITLLMQTLLPSAIIIMTISPLSVWEDTWLQLPNTQKKYTRIKSCL
ncbi:hypothetical protein [Methanobacterium ferruginis]|uniref:hypothetical protein n=1 Tax=Methanobacterium ferruginis TaxID=710191 RepID=UPI002573842D|nr:hypothetical protein [Methanobacterium ferruginis]